jgi:3-methyladenine DNA glycosylase/8-oxoguanine DNA glycosylase
MENEEIIERLTSIRGIGRWTVEMLADTSDWGRPDVLPVTDYGVRKGFARAFRKRKLP